MCSTQCVEQWGDAGARLPRAGVASNEPAATELISLPNETAEFCNLGPALWFQQQTNCQNQQENAKSDHRWFHSIGKNQKIAERV